MILDTNAVSALLAGDPNLGRLLSSATHHELPAIVMGEYRYGLRRSTRRAVLEPMFDTLISQSTVLGVSEDTTHHYAEVRDELRRLGTPIPENDVWIAALAVQFTTPIVSRDAHFDRVHAVTRIGW